MEADAGDSQDNTHNEDEQFYNDENSENFDQDEGEHDGNNRSWGPPVGQPRFRGRSFGPSPTPPRGRGAFRSRGASNGGSRFGNPNSFENNWSAMGQQPPFGPLGMSGPPPLMSQQFAPPEITQPPVVQELWVETKTEEGKSYYYHALSRETTWTRPEGLHVKIMTQLEIEAMNKQQQQQAAAQQDSPKPEEGVQQKQTDESAVTLDSDKKEAIADNLPASKTNGIAEIKNPAVMNTMPPVTVASPAIAQLTAAQPLMNFPSFGMPPPGFQQMPPWGNWPPTAHPPMFPDPKKPEIVDPAILTKAAEWSEHKAPDGRPYFYHSIRGESVWEKPAALVALDAARHMSSMPMMPGGISGMMSTNSAILQHQQQQQQISGVVMFDPLGSMMSKTGESTTGNSKIVESDSEREKKRKQEAEKKKKEEEEKSKQLAAAKQQDKSRPISSTPISGTPWCVVWTGDGRVFFYNPSSRTSVWERPEDLIQRADVDKAVGTPPEQLLGSQVALAAAAAHSTKKNGDDDSSKTSINDGGVVMMDLSTSEKKRSDSESSENSDETPNKKVKVDVQIAVPVKQAEKRPGDAGKEAAIEAEMRAARERALIPLENRVKSFKEMLKEKDVSAFSTWEKELHKIVFDPRYLLLTSRERKQVFEKYVKDRAEEERREKRNKMRQKRDDFRSLMVENIHGKSSFSEFAQKYGKDQRFKGIDKIRERENLFNEYIVEIRKKEKDEKQQRKEEVRKDFMALLRENKEIDRHSRWADVKKRLDSEVRYKAVGDSLLREDYFHDYCKILKDEKRRTKEKKEKKNEKRDREEKKSKEKDKSGKDKNRDKDKDRDSDRKEEDGKEDSKTDDEKEKDNEEHEDGEHPLTSEDESERQQKDRDRQMRAEASIKEREKEVQRTLACHLRDRDKEREHHKRDEAMRHFSALLADLVRNADLKWKEVKKQLKKDHRYEAVEILDRDDRERLFNDHISNLTKKKRDKFREMIDEIPEFDLNSSWKDIKKTVRDDPRYLKFNSSEICEREFRDYVRDKNVLAKASFKELLLECKLITHKSLDSVKENPNHLKEIEDILKNDKRYLVLDHIKNERTGILTMYLEDLFKRGPPPPPTACESSRRK